MAQKRSAGVIIWKNRAFVPSQAITDVGMLVQVEPVLELDLSADALGPVLHRVLTAELPRIKHPTQSEWKTRRDPVLAKTGAKSWRELARKGAGGGVVEVPDGYLVSFSRRTPEGDWQEDLSRQRRFSSDTSFVQLAQELLDGLLGYDYGSVQNQGAKPGEAGPLTLCQVRSCSVYWPLANNGMQLTWLIGTQNRLGRLAEATSGDRGALAPPRS